jgi:hypothetical protein
MTTPVADGNGSPFSSKIAAYRRVFPRRSGTRARLPCMIYLGVQARTRQQESAMGQLTGPGAGCGGKIPSFHISSPGMVLTECRICLFSDDRSSIATGGGCG